MFWREGISAWLAMAIASCSPVAEKPQTVTAPAPSVAQSEHSGQLVTSPAVGPPAAPAAPGSIPPTVDGIYSQADVCSGEGCYLKGKIKAYEEAKLFDKAGAKAATRKIAAGEWVEVVSTEYRIVPWYGVVREGRKSFATGEVVYRLWSEGDGCFAVWASGLVKSWCDPRSVGDPETNDMVDWERIMIVLDRSDETGLWVRVKRADGSEGWLHNAWEFACTGYQDRDADCPVIPQ